MLRDIKYAELVFRLEFLEDSVLPKYKVLMLNGALLNVLLSLYCINKRKCNGCNILSKCLIQKILGDNYEADKPLILQSHYMQPYYLIDCNDNRICFRQNQELTFSIRLINKAIDYISQFIYIFDQLGNIGLGPNRAKYSLIGIYNDQKKPVFQNGILHEENIHIKSISDYIAYRKSHIKDKITLMFTTPYIQEQDHLNFFINVNNLFYSIKNRLNSLNVIEEKDMELLDEFEDDKNSINFNLNIVKRNYLISKLKQNKTIVGFKGEISFSNEFYKLLDYLIACEKLNIGGHILLGYGRLAIKGEG